MQITGIWINCSSVDIATTIGDTLIAERLVACSNLYAPIQSAYRWKGDIARETEHPLLVKTRADLGDMVEARVRDLHPYEVPPILRVIIDAANADYIAWVYGETRNPA
ncbi:MAG: divalent-cation tolerance protein CutA [Pseudomonadota bacterium]